MPSSPTRALLFDLGGVVIDFSFERAMALWEPHSRLSPQDLRAAFRHDTPFEHFEVGALSRPEYFTHLRATLDLTCGDAVLEEAWNATLIAEIPETAAMIDQVRERVPCYALTNTNPPHLDTMRSAFPGMLARFRHVFSSTEIGCRKPEAEAFRRVVAAIGVPAAEILFLDDLPVNVEAGRAFGLQAALVRGPEDVRRELTARGFLCRAGS